jgi:polyphosphate kinase 2 (PPK2 family)
MARHQGKNHQAGKNHRADTGVQPPDGENPGRVPRKLYDRELLRLQAELVKLQEWVRAERTRLVVVFEGRDAAGKGSTINRVTEYLNPRLTRIVALPVPSERERGRCRRGRSRPGMCERRVTRRPLFPTTSRICSRAGQGPAADSRPGSDGSR